MKKIFTLFFLMFFVVMGVYGQTAIQYGFNASVGTYTELPSPTILGTPTGNGTSALDDVNYRVNFPAGFTFSYEGVAQTALNINTNGFVGFGTVIWTNSASYLPLSTNPGGGTTAGVISAFGADLNSYSATTPTGDISWQVIGTGSDEAFVVQYKNFKPYENSGTVDRLLNFQIILYESSHATKANHIELVYGNCAIGDATSNDINVGIRSSGTGWAANVNSVMLANIPSGTTCNWLNAVSSNNNTNGNIFNNSNTAATIPNGLVYSFFPQSGPNPVRTFAAATVTHNTATISWTAPTGATQYNVQYRTPNSCTWTNWTGNPVTGTTATITGLNPETVYQYRVQASNGTLNSTWSHIPNTAGGGNGYTANGSFLTTPPPCDGTPVAGTISGTLARYICSGSAPGVVTVTGATSSIIPGIGYQWEQSVNNGTDWANAVGGTGATTTSYTPPNYAGTPIQYRLRVTCANGGGTIVSDVLSVNNRIAPTTQATALTAAPANISLSSFGLSWTTGNGDRRQVYVSTTPITDPVDATGVTITANAAFANTGQQLVFDGTGTSVTVTGLTCGTQYYVKVFEYNRCGSGPYNVLYLVPGATNAITVTTSTPATAPALPVTNNFPGLTDTNLSTIAPGWYEAVGTTTSSFIPVVGNSNWTGSTALPTPTAKVNLYDNDFNVWIISPKMAITANSRLKFKAAITGYNTGNADPERMVGTDDKVNVLVSTDGCGAVWTVIHTFNAANTTTLTNVLTDFTLPLNYTGQTIQIAFQGVDGPLDELPDYDFHIGNIVVELVPQCDIPTALTVANITKNSATISWAVPPTGTPTGYQYVVSTSSTAPAGAGIDVAGTVTSVNVTPLLPSTTYYVFVRTTCGSDFSGWTLSQTFKTACDYEDITGTPGTRCGTGTVSLSAVATGGTLNWISANGSLLGTGSTFTTPVIDATTTFYVKAVESAAGTGIVGTATTLTGDTEQPTAFCNRWGSYKNQIIYTAQDLTAAGLTMGNITSIAFNVATLGDGATNSNFKVRIANTSLSSFPNETYVTTGFSNVYGPVTYTHTATGWQTINFTTPYYWDGESNIIIEISHQGANSTNNTQTYYTATSNPTVLYNTSDLTATTGTLSPKRLNITFGGQVGCSSPKTAIVATVTPAPAFELSEDTVEICNGFTSAAVTVATGAADYDAYVWSPATGVTGSEGAGWTFNPTATTTYTLTATNTTSGCTNIVEMEVIVNALPHSFAVSPDPVVVCENGVSQMTVPVPVSDVTATIGTGTTANGGTTFPNPFTAWYGGTKTQILFKAAELEAQGLVPNNDIHSIAFDFAASVDKKCQDLTIRIGNTAVADMTNGFVPSAPLTTVYNADFTPVAGATGYKTFTFNTPYFWTGGDIIVEVIFNSGNGGNGNGTTVKYTATTYNSVYYGAKDNVIPAGVASLDAVAQADFSNKGASMSRPNIRFVQHADNDITWSPVTNLYTNAAATTPYVAGTTSRTVYVKGVAPETYTVTVTNEHGCVTTADVDVTITITPAPTANATQTICNAGTVANLQTTSGTGILWYADATGGTPLATTTVLVDGEDYFASQTVGGCESVARTEVTVEINVTAAPTVDETTQTFCNAGTVADLQTTSGTGILWYADATGGTALVSTTALVDGEDYFASQTIDGCESAARTEVTVEINVTAAPTVDETTQTFCHTGTVADLDANGDNIVWYSDPTAADAQLDPEDVLTDGTSYFASQTIDGCESATRTEVIVVITSTPAPTVDQATQTFCNAGTVAGLQANGDDILWYATADGETPLAETDALENGIYYGSQTVDGCESIARVEVTVVINVTPAPTVENATQSFCNAATVADLDANGDNILWYASADGETPLAETDALVDGAVYYGAQTIDGCESLERTEVTAEINITPAPEGNEEQMIEVVDLEEATIEDIVVTLVEGGTITWYPTEEDALAGTNAIEAGTQLETETTYYATQTVGSCTSADVLAVTVTVTLDSKEFNSAAFTYYPNPVKDVLTLSYSQDISNVTVYNMIGQPVMTQQINAVEGRINMSNLADGTYMVNVTFGNTVKTIRVIKKQ